MKPPATAPGALPMPPSTAAAKAYSSTPDIMCTSRKTTGATIIPATAPIAAASPQPSASIQPTRTPTRRLDTGFCAAARIARPTGVKRKKPNTRASTTSVTAMEPSPCALMPRIGCEGKGLGKGLIV